MRSRLVPFLYLLLSTRPLFSQAPRLPSRSDLTPEFQKLGIVARSQGARDTCSLFAITAVADFEWARKHGPAQPRLSEEFLVWAANSATGLKGDQAMFYEATHGLNALGACSASLMPYSAKSDAARAPSARALADAKTRAGCWKAEWIKRWCLKSPLSDAQLAAIKRALAGGHPVAVGFRWPKALKGPALLAVPPPSGVFDGHSVVLVGYADDPKAKGGGTFTFHNSAGPGWGAKGHGTMSYAYARAYANDAVWLNLGPAGSEVPTLRFEAESNLAASSRCSTGRQKMADWGGGMWSGGEQLFCRPEGVGSVVLSFNVRKAGRYRARLLATTAPDFGTIRVSLDGKPAGGTFDLYSGRVSPTGPLELGTFTLRAGNHRLSVASAGKNANSTNYFFGLDAIDLIAVK